MTDSIFDEILYEFEFQGKKCSFSRGKYARRSNSAIFAKMGDTVVLATVDYDKSSEVPDFFPLTVEYIERMFAGGVISSSRFIKREGHPSTEAVLSSRMIDRSIRSRFPSDFRMPVQVVLTVLSFDPECDPVILGMSAISLALSLSDVPFDGPIAGVRMGYDGEKVIPFIKNLADTDQSMEDRGSKLNLVIGTDGEIVTMIDSDSEEVSEDVIINGMNEGLEVSKELINAQKKFIELFTEKNPDFHKATYEPYVIPKDLISEIKKNKKSQMESILDLDNMTEKDKANEELKALAFKEYEGKYSKSQISDAYDYVSKLIVRDWIVNDKRRTDGRALDEIRPIAMEIGVLPRAHGSAMFNRGNTQAITVTTLGSGRLAQLVQGMEGEGTRRYMHHYNAPDYTVGCAGQYKYFPKRRELGHGALAEKALMHVIPGQEEFPYTIRVVSEIMSQSGSSSMASVCGSTLSLMDAGVPIKKPVAGIAIGVVTGETMDDFTILTDIAEYEDFFGDMDFKVAGTRDGITAIQMDNKLNGISVKIFEEALEAAKKARFQLIDMIEDTISAPKEHLSIYAPKIETVKIPTDKIGMLVGPGGKNIKALIESTGTDIEIDDNGLVSVSSIDEESRKKAIDHIKSMFEEPEVGKIYRGTVGKIMDFGVFVDINPNFSGLVHISELSDSFVKDPSTVVKEGQQVDVMFIGLDDKGRAKMSIKKVKKNKDNGSNPSKTD
ncbi:polyribonucleotide nucleotidyltransferase [Candidatus Dojkabacteria bacterium]|nr:polyribonucleotide nucleotidyltransferase [Candidatus Dojkabacteria bacterium]